jgi:hypothetical protein
MSRQEINFLVEFLLQIAAKAKADCQISVPGKLVRLAQYFFPFTTVGAKAIPASAKYSALAAGIPLTTDRLEYSLSRLAISLATEMFRGLSKGAEGKSIDGGSQENFRCRKQIQGLAASQK